MKYWGLWQKINYGIVKNRISKKLFRRSEKGIHRWTFCYKSDLQGRVCNKAYCYQIK